MKINFNNITYKVNLISLFLLYRKIKRLFKKWKKQHPDNNDAQHNED